MEVNDWMILGELEQKAKKLPKRKTISGRLIFSSSGGSPRLKFTVGPAARKKILRKVCFYRRGLFEFSGTTYATTYEGLSRSLVRLLNIRAEKYLREGFIDDGD